MAPRGAIRVHHVNVNQTGELVPRGILRGETRDAEQRRRFVLEMDEKARVYGERYPLVANSSEANRAKNRRVTLRLEREAAAVANSTETAAPSS